MANLREQLEALLAPRLPHPVPPLADPAYQTWRKRFERYVERKTKLHDQIHELGGLHAAA
ncbi:hypothetical protein [Geothrix campi]|uniref:hypothetical protein n=1 Tax=Geothrix campi TaxID=2966450 RepID=UPI00214863AB|nr:hypothetical protein [Geothrix sp. SG10]